MEARQGMNDTSTCEEHPNALFLGADLSGHDGVDEPFDGSGSSLLPTHQTQLHSPSVSPFSGRRRSHSPRQEDADGPAEKKRRTTDVDRQVGTLPRPSSVEPCLQEPSGRLPQIPRNALITAAPAVQEIPALLNTYTCPICLDVPRNASVTPCGHLMCGECLFKTLRAEVDKIHEGLEIQERQEVVRDLIFPRRPGRMRTQTQTEQFFLTATQLVTVFHEGVIKGTENFFERFIIDCRDLGRSSEAWDTFLRTILDTATRIRRRSQQKRSHSCTARPQVCLPVTNAVIRRYLCTTDASVLAAFLSCTRNPNNSCEDALVDIRDEIAINPLFSRETPIQSPLPAEQPNERNANPPTRGCQPNSLTPDGHTVFWFAFRTHSDLHPMHNALCGMQVILSTLEIAARQIPDRSPLPPPGRYPRIPAEAVMDVAASIVPFAEVNCTVQTLRNDDLPLDLKYDALDRLSAALWAALDQHNGRGRTYAEFFAAGIRQRGMAAGTYNPVEDLTSPEGNLREGRRSQQRELNTDPMAGFCPVCRSHIPGGFFAGTARNGISGLKFKLGKPTDELHLRYGAEFGDQAKQGRVAPRLVSKLVGESQERHRAPRPVRPFVLPDTTSRSIAHIKSVDGNFDDMDGLEGFSVLPVREVRSRSNSSVTHAHRESLVDLLDYGHRSLGHNRPHPGRPPDPLDNDGNTANNPIVLS